MLQIRCPWCGIRDEDEFFFGGEGGIIMPADLDNIPDSEWADYLFNRDNPLGLHLERWQHIYGCRQWFMVERDTATHIIHKTSSFGETDTDEAME